MDRDCKFITWAPHVLALCRCCHFLLASLPEREASSISSGSTSRVASSPPLPSHVAALYLPNCQPTWTCDLSACQQNPPASVNSSACRSSPPVILPDPPCFSAQTPGSCYCRTSLQVQYASLNDWNQIAPDVWMFSIFLWIWIWALMCCSFLLVSD